MALNARSEAHVMPTYSLTGDLLSYLRCQLQYRYQNGAALPPSRPIQLWFGEFIHGVLELSYELWRQESLSFPWPYDFVEWKNRKNGTGLPKHNIGEIGRLIENVLAIQGKIPRSSEARALAYERAAEAINVIGPHLFPLVVFAEEPLIGSRPLKNHKIERYEVTGVADVLTHMSMGNVPPNNIIRQQVESAIGVSNLPTEYEVIVDYKGASRPDTVSQKLSYWQQHDWQIQMYSWLRSRKPNSKPVVAGIIIYVNELLPGAGDIEKMHKQISQRNTDVFPATGSNDSDILSRKIRGKGRDLSEDFRVNRAVRVIPVNSASMQVAGEEFDKVVLEIERRIEQEADIGIVKSVWTPNCADQDTCSACDFRYFCPKQNNSGNQNVPVIP